MRTSAFSGLAVLASSLLVKDIFASPLRQRDYVVEDLVVTEVITVTQDADGSFHTAAPFAIGTFTSQGTVRESATSVEISSTPVATPISSLVASNSSSVISSPTTSSVASSTAAATSAAAHAADKVAVPVEESPIVAIEAKASTTPKPTPTPTPTPTTLSKVVATLASSTVVSVPSASSVPVSSGDKRGLAYNDPTLLAGFTTLAGTKTSWAYNWGSTAGGTVPSGLEYVPMLWGLRSEDTANWKSSADKALAAGSTHLLGNNEPDLGTQSNLTPLACAQGWIANMQQYAGKATLVGPAVTNGPASSNMGLTWLGEFLTECGKLGCTIDRVALHWYGDASNFADFKQHITDAYTAGNNRPLWITEFQGSGSVAQQQAFLAQALPFLDSLSYVERYAYFMVADGNLVSGNSVSALGNTFATAA